MAEPSIILRESIFIFTMFFITKAVWCFCLEAMLFVSAESTSLLQTDTHPVLPSMLCQAVGEKGGRTFHWVSPIPLAFTWRLIPPSGLSQQRTFVIENLKALLWLPRADTRLENSIVPIQPFGLGFVFRVLWVSGRKEGSASLHLLLKTPLLICVQNEKISCFSITPFWFSSWGTSTVVAVGHGSAVTNMSVYTIVY